MLLKNLIPFFLFIILIQGCLDQNCQSCDNFIEDNAGVRSIKQICYQCGSGFNLIKQKCQDDIGLIIGLSIGAFFAILIQIACYIYCHRQNIKRNQKKQIDFRQIFNHKKKQQLIKIRLLQLDECKEQFNDKICCICEKIATIKTNCNHYFDLNCFYTKIQQKMMQQNQKQQRKRQEKKKETRRLKLMKMKEERQKEQNNPGYIKKQNDTEEIEQQQLHPQIFPRCPFQKCKFKNDPIQFTQVCYNCRRRKVHLLKLMQNSKNCHEYECAHCKLSNLYNMDDQTQNNDERQVAVQTKVNILADNIQHLE